MLILGIQFFGGRGSGGASGARGGGRAAGGGTTAGTGAKAAAKAPTTSQLNSSSGKQLNKSLDEAAVGSTITSRYKVTERSLNGDTREAFRRKTYTKRADGKWGFGSSALGPMGLYTKKKSYTSSELSDLLTRRKSRGGSITDSAMKR